jgi:hypothetical protein
MATMKEIIKQLRATADASPEYRNKWLSDDNWLVLIKGHHTNSCFTSTELNNALSRHCSTKDIIDVTDNSLNKSGIYRQKFPVLDNDGKTRRVSFYCLNQSGSTAEPAEWGSRGGGRTKQAICHSASLDEYTTMSADDVKKSPREEARTEIRRSKRTAPKGRKIVSTPERRPNSVSRIIYCAKVSRQGGNAAAR